MRHKLKGPSIGILKKALSLALCGYLVQAGGGGKAWAEDRATLRIAAVEGVDAIHVLKGNRVAPVVIEAQNSNGEPLSGVTVQFDLPAAGPGGAFDKGKRTLSTVTDRHGRARMNNLHLNGEGTFRIQVTALYREQTASLTLNQRTIAELATTRTLFMAPPAGGLKSSASSHTGSGLGKKILKVVAGVAIVGGITYGMIWLAQNGTTNVDCVVPQYPDSEYYTGLEY